LVFSDSAPKRDRVQKQPHVEALEQAQVLTRPQPKRRKSGKQRPTKAFDSQVGANVARPSTVPIYHSSSHLRDIDTHSLTISSSNHSTPTTAVAPLHRRSGSPSKLSISHSKSVSAHGQRKRVVIVDHLSSQHSSTSVGRRTAWKDGDTADNSSALVVIPPSSSSVAEAKSSKLDDSNVSGHVDNDRRDRRGRRRVSHSTRSSSAASRSDSLRRVYENVPAGGGSGATGKYKTSTANTNNSNNNSGSGSGNTIFGPNGRSLSRTRSDGVLQTSKRKSKSHAATNGIHFVSVSINTTTHGEANVHGGHEGNDRASRSAHINERIRTSPLRQRLVGRVRHSSPSPSPPTSSHHVSQGNNHSNASRSRSPAKVSASHRKTSSASSHSRSSNIATKVFHIDDNNNATSLKPKLSHSSSTPTLPRQRRKNITSLPRLSRDQISGTLVVVPPPSTTTSSSTSTSSEERRLRRLINELLRDSVDSIFSRTVTITSDDINRVIEHGGGAAATYQYLSRLSSARVRLATLNDLLMSLQGAHLADVMHAVRGSLSDFELRRQVLTYLSSDQCFLLTNTNTTTEPIKLELSDIESLFHQCGAGAFTIAHLVILDQSNRRFGSLDELAHAVKLLHVAHSQTEVTVSSFN
jgi:hypothetical protein